MHSNNVRRMFAAMAVAAAITGSIPYNVLADPVAATCDTGKISTISQSVIRALPQSYDITNKILSISDFPGMKGTVVFKEYKIGSKFYTFNNKKGEKKTTGGGYHYVKVGNKYVYVAGAQCLAGARWFQQKIYGVNDGANKKKFKSVGSLSASEMTEDTLRSLLKKAGRGAHIRTGGRQHSFIVLKVTDKKITLWDVNGTAGSGRVGVKTYSYKQYIESWGKRGIDYVNIKK